MKKIQIIVSSDQLTINGNTWGSPPFIEQVCQAVGSENLTDGDVVVIHGKPESKFRYFDDLGLSILETIPDRRVRRVSIHMQTPPIKRKPVSPYGNGGERSTKETFCGRLHLNGRELSSPLRFRQFPLNGQLLFVNRIAIGNRLSAMVSVVSGFVQTVTFDFRAEA